MLLLLFEIGTKRYALDTGQVIEIVPLVDLKPLAAAPGYIAGMMNYRGEGVPVIDLNQLMDAVSFADLFSTRIIIVKFPVAADKYRPLALIANNVTETVRAGLTGPPAAGFIMHKSLYDDETAPETGDMIGWFDIKNMLPAGTVSLLFAGAE